MPPRVSVVMPVYNGERYLAEAIASILGQTYADFECIVVDDGSSDGSAAIAEEYRQRDSRVQFIHLAHNVGSASARNRGIDIASGEYVAMMDSDDICLPDRLRKQVTYLDANPQIGVLGTNVRYVDQELRYRHDSKLPLDHPGIAWGMFFSPSISDVSTMVRRELLLAAGGYEEGRRICDGVELWFRLMECTRFANLTDILRLYRRHPQAKTFARTERHEEARADLCQNALARLWGEASQETAIRFRRVSRREKDFRRAERKLLRTEMTRLIESFVDAGWIEAGERPQLLETMEGRLLQSRPRRCHFWKYLR